ncbi:MAG: hypothetical protein HY235_00975 [Acidobacteria bacterium]|nr:hypothetical protein [Acidobacteriota bacterium]
MHDLGAVVSKTREPVRRELLRAGKERGLGRLDALKGMLGYAPITTSMMLKAAEFWATARNMGRRSADDARIPLSPRFCCQRVRAMSSLKARRLEQ